MKAGWFTVVLAATALAGGCGGGTAADDAGAPEESAPADGVLLDAAKRPLARAGEVEALSAGRKDALDAQIEGDADDPGEEGAED